MDLTRAPQVESQMTGVEITVKSTERNKSERWQAQPMRTMAACGIHTPQHVTSMERKVAENGGRKRVSHLCWCSGYSKFKIQTSLKLNRK